MKPEFVPWLWIIYVAYVLYKRHRENNHLEKSILILASISLIIIVLFIMKTLFGV